MRRTLIIVVVALSALTLTAGMAVAQADPLADADHRTHGGLAAVGTGTVHVEAEEGWVRMWLVGDATIEGPADLDIRVESWEDAGIAPEADVTRVELTGFSGAVAIRGVDFTVDAEGVFAVRGHGRGFANLDGTGLWRTRRDRGLWPADIGVGA